MRSFDVYLRHSARILTGNQGQGKSKTCIQHAAETGGFLFALFREEGGLRKTFPNGSAVYGSQDLQLAITEILKNKSKFSDIAEDPQQIEDNREAVEHIALTVACSRVFVFNAFLDCRPDDISLEDWLHDWTAFEVASELCDPDRAGPLKDIFVRVSALLRKASTEVLHRLIRFFWHQITSKCPRFLKFFPLLLDEASFGLLLWNTSHFRCRDLPDEPCSVLTEIFLVWMKLEIFTSSVFSSQSGVSADTMRRALEPTATLFGWKTVEVSIEGGFRNSEEHREFLRNKLQGWADENHISKKSFESFLTRAVTWLRGRYVPFQSSIPPENITYNRFFRLQL